MKLKKTALYLRRKIDDELKRWKSCEDRLPLILKGAQSLRTLIRSDAARDITWGIKLINGNVGFEDSVLTLPQWCAFLLPKVVEEFRVKPKFGSSLLHPSGYPHAEAQRRGVF